ESHSAVSRPLRFYLRAVLPARVIDGAPLPTRAGNAPQPAAEMVQPPKGAISRWQTRRPATPPSCRVQQAPVAMKQEPGGPFAATPGLSEQPTRSMSKYRAGFRGAPFLGCGTGASGCGPPPL